MLAIAPFNAIILSLLMKEDGLLCRSASGLATAAAACSAINATCIFYVTKAFEAGSLELQLRFVPPLGQVRARGRHDDVDAVPGSWAGKAGLSDCKDRPLALVGLYKEIGYRDCHIGED